MKKESRDRVLQAYDEAFRLMKFPSFNQGIRFICRELNRQLAILRQARTRTGLEATLTKETEPDPQELEAVIAAIRLLPYHLRKALPTATKEAAKQLPHLPGGRPHLLTPEDCQQVCAQIGALLGEGVELKEAQRRLAQQKGVSWRTIQRVWQKRNQPGPVLEK